MNRSRFLTITESLWNLAIVFILKGINVQAKMKQNRIMLVTWFASIIQLNHRCQKRRNSRLLGREREVEHEIVRLKRVDAIPA